VRRDGVLGKLDRQLMLGSGCPGLILYGRRRMGKSTLLGNLDGFLPDSVHIVVLSLQDAAAFTSLGYLARHIADTVTGAWPRAERDGLPVLSSADLPGLAGFLDACNRRLEQVAEEAVGYGDAVLRQLLRPEDGSDAEWRYLRRFRDHRSLPRPENSKVEQALLRRWMLVEEGEGYRLRVPLMGRWLRHNVLGGV